MTKTTAMTTLLVLLMAACGSSGAGGGDPVVPPGDDPGEGSSTLLVTGIVEATENVNSAVGPEDFDSSFAIAVTLNGDEVRDAIVTVTSLGGSVELDFDTSGSPGRYRGTQVGYFGDYRFDIDAGNDFVAGVVVEAPDVHRILAPLPGARVPSDQDLVVQWSRDGVADSAEIETRELGSTAIDDTGSFTVDKNDLRQDPLRDEDERVRLFRSSQVTPNGAIAGSNFEVRLRNSVEFVVEPPQ